MRHLRFTYSTGLSFSGPVSEHQYTLRCLPLAGNGQTLLEHQLLITPGPAPCFGRDGFGSTLIYGSVLTPHTAFCCRTEGVAAVDRGRVEQGCNPALRYPGMLTQPDAALRAFYAALPLGGLTPLEKCCALSRAVGEHFAYLPGATGVNTTAAEAFALGAGVCQDYAHVLVVLARLAGLPARYCMGLAVGEGATHAWAEVYLPEVGWRGFDATRGCLEDEGYLVFATGRDAADCPAERGIFRGNVSQTQTVFMTCVEIGGHRED